MLELSDYRSPSKVQKHFFVSVLVTKILGFRRSAPILLSPWPIIFRAPFMDYKHFQVYTYYVRADMSLLSPKEKLLYYE